MLLWSLMVAIVYFFMKKILCMLSLNDEDSILLFESIIIIIQIFHCYEIKKRKLTERFCLFRKSLNSVYRIMGERLKKQRYVHIAPLWHHSFYGQKTLFRILKFCNIKCLMYFFFNIMFLKYI